MFAKVFAMYQILMEQQNSAKQNICLLGCLNSASAMVLDI
jgi:hypothetical protein